MSARRRAGTAAGAAVALLIILAPDGGSGALAQAPAGAAETATDWPCVQRKVPRLSPATVWSGPAIDGLEGGWSKDAGLQDFARTLASRRTPIEEAGRLIAAFAASQGDAEERRRRLTLLFAATFAEIDGLRSEIVHGIERYTRNQRKLALAIDQTRAEIQAPEVGKDLSEADRKKRQDRSDDLSWRMRIFQERENSLRYVCENPTLLEQRLYRLAQEIQKHM